MATPFPRLRNVASTTWTLIAEVSSLIGQVALIWIGIEFLFAEDDDNEMGALVLWCLIGTLYLIGTTIWLNIDLHVHDGDHALTKRASAGRLMSIFSSCFAFLSSAVGLVAAIWLLLMRSEPDHLAIVELIPVWAMLLSWALFHWGYARLYHSRYLRAGEKKPIEFPGTEHPRLTDFVYFAFTNGTTFGVSDSLVTDSKMRWTVVWHTSLSFFFNALIIVLTMNTIAGGFEGF